MGYLFLALALAAGVTKGYCGKMTSGSVSTSAEAMMANLVRMVLCIVIGFLMLTVQGNLSGLAVDGRALLIMLGSGITTSVFVVAWLICVKYGAYMMLDVFLLIGVLVPMLLCNWLYGEPITGTQWIGVVILLAAVLIMCSYNVSIKGKMSIKSVLLLILCGLANGLTDFCQKSYTHYYPEGNAAVFNFYTYVASALTLVVFYFLFRRVEQSAGKPRSAMEIVKPIFGYVLVMALCLFANSYFKVLASGYLTATQLFPLNQGTAIVLSTLMSATLFREKITVRCIIGLVLAFAALLIMNLL